MTLRAPPALLKPALFLALLGPVALSGGAARATVFLPVTEYQRWVDLAEQLRLCAERGLPRLLSPGTPDASVADRALSACERQQRRFETAYLEAGEPPDELDDWRGWLRRDLAEAVATLRAKRAGPAS